MAASRAEAAATGELDATGGARPPAALDALPAGEPAPPDEPTPEARVDALLDWLDANRYQSQQRFVESRVHARAGRFGNLRIRQELQQHQLSVPPDAAAALAASELDRARAVLQRRYPQPASTAPERARRARFLAGRGFSGDVIRRAIRSEGDDGDAPEEVVANLD